MYSVQKCSAFLSRTAVLAALASVGASPAGANTFEFTYTGTFSSADALNLQGSSTQFFADGTPFTATALFSDTSPNIAAPVGVSGFVSYSPVLATLTVGGQTYNVTTYDQSPAQGVTVTVFDATTPFEPNHYGIGFLQNPLADGAGFIGDWLTANPAFDAAHLTSTVFSDYQGVGVGSGPLDPNNVPTIVPIPLNDGRGNTYLLTLGNYDEEFSQGAPLNTARLTVVPEPAPWSILTIGCGSLMFKRRSLRRTRKPQC